MYKIEILNENNQVCGKFGWYFIYNKNNSYVYIFCLKNKGALFVKKQHIITVRILELVFVLRNVKVFIFKKLTKQITCNKISKT